MARASTWSRVASHPGRRRAGSGARPVATRGCFVIGAEEFAGVGEQAVEGLLGAAVGLGGAVAEADDPLGGVTEVVGGFLFGFRGDGGETGVGGGGQSAPPGVDVGGVEKLAEDGVSEVAVGELEEEEVAVLRGVAQVGELVLIVAGGFELGGEGVE